MKLPTNKSDKNMEAQAGPKFRNINEEREVTEEKPKGADVRLKVLACVILILAVFVGIKGTITKSSLTSQVTDQSKELEEARKTASGCGIEIDDDDNIILPEIDTSLKPSTANIPEGDLKTLDDFTKLLLNWKGQEGYKKVRETLINEWGFSADCKLLSSFMPETAEELNVNMSIPMKDNRPDSTIFTVAKSEEGNTYFLICPVRNTVNGTSASGIVGLQIKLSKESKITNITAQTLS